MKSLLFKLIAPPLFVILNLADFATVILATPHFILNGTAKEEWQDAITSAVKGWKHLLGMYKS